MCIVLSFLGYMYSVSAQGIVGRVINARYYYYYYYYYYLLKATAQGHHRDCHKFKSYTCHIKKEHLTLNKQYTKRNNNICLIKHTNSTLGISLVYNTNKAGTCWHR